MCSLWRSAVFKLTFHESLKGFNQSGLWTWHNAPNKPSASLQYAPSDDKKIISKPSCRLLNEVTIPFPSRFHPLSREANNSEFVCVRFKSLTKSLSSCCVVGWGDLTLVKTIWILACYTGCNSMLVVWKAPFAFIVSCPLPWELWNVENVVRDLTYWRGQIRVLNTMFEFCREVFHVGQREITFSDVIILLTPNPLVHSVEQKSIGLKFCKSRTGSHVTYSCQHNLSRFSFPIFVHSWHFSVFHSLQSITPRLY